MASLTTPTLTDEERNAFWTDKDQASLDKWSATKVAKWNGEKGEKAAEKIKKKYPTMVRTRTSTVQYRLAENIFEIALLLLRRLRLHRLHRLLLLLV